MTASADNPRTPVGGTFSLTRIDALILGIAAIAFLACFAGTIRNDRFGYDESDYMYAASKGFAANYFDRPSISVAEFVRRGLDEGHHRVGPGSLSVYIRGSDDITFYRHFHAPLYFYWIAGASALFGSGEATVRAASLLLLLLSFATVYVGLMHTMQEDARTAAVLAGALLLLSPVNIATASVITPHGMYLLCVLVSLFVMARLIQTRDIVYWWASVVTVSFAVLSIEYAAILFLTQLVVAVVHRRDLFAGWDRRRVARFVGGSALLYALVLALVWPAGLLKLTIVKNYVFFAWFAAVRSSAYGTESFLRVWWHRLASSPVEYALVLSSIPLFVYTFIRQHRLRWLLPFVVYALLMLLTTFRNRSPEPTYVSSLLPALYVICGATLGERLRSHARVWRISTGVVVLLGLSVANYVEFYIPTTQSTAATANNALIGFLERHAPDGSRLLVPKEVLPTVHYYFPTTQLTPYGQTSDDGELLGLLSAEKFDGIILTGPPSGQLLSRLGQSLGIGLEQVEAARVTTATPGYFHVGEKRVPSATE